MAARARLRRRGGGRGWEGSGLLPSFEGEEQEVLVLPNGPAGGTAELVLIALAAPRGDDVVLTRVRVEDGVSPKVEQRAMPVIGSGSDDRIDVPAAGAAVIGVISVHHHLKFLDGLHIGRNAPRGIRG